MLTFINQFNLFIFIVFTALYCYQLIYVGVVLFKGKKYDSTVKAKAAKEHRYAVITSARNESAVIAELIRSVKRQNYPAELLDIYVIADNCTDNTAEVAREAGAIVYERFNKELVGKGYALDFLFKTLYTQHPEEHYDGYFVFDADNLLDENYITEMNKVFDDGYKVVTSYRNSKNYGDNWITAGYALWFLRESKYLNKARMMLHTSCAISGTGFLVSDQIIRRNNGWKYHLLTEDIEFSIDSIIHGELIGYCDKAIIYDEQPISFKQSWDQRLRWSKGFYQVIFNYGTTLFKSIFSKDAHSFSCFDMLMTIMPAMFLSLFSVLVNAWVLTSELSGIYVMQKVVDITSFAIICSFVNFYGILFLLGLITTVTEWQNIKCAASKKVGYIFTFPLFIFTYIPISIVALFKNVEWKPIAHGVVKSLDEVR